MVITFNSTAEILEAVNIAVWNRIKFEVIPLPFDKWDIDIKEEHEKLLENIRIKSEIKKGMALAFFGCAYAEQAEEKDVQLQGEIMGQLPEIIDSFAIHAAITLIKGLLLKNGVDSLDTFYNVLIKGCDPKGADKGLSPELFGHYCAMQAMGTGVGLESFGYQMQEIIIVPYVDFGSHSLSEDYFK